MPRVAVLEPEQVWAERLQPQFFAGPLEQVVAVPGKAWRPALKRAALREVSRGRLP
jgi:hypothetical protein